MYTAFWKSLLNVALHCRFHPMIDIDHCLNIAFIYHTELAQTGRWNVKLWRMKNQQLQYSDTVVFIFWGHHRGILKHSQLLLQLRKLGESSLLCKMMLKQKMVFQMCCANKPSANLNKVYKVCVAGRGQKIGHQLGYLQKKNLNKLNRKYSGSNCDILTPIVAHR